MIKVALITTWAPERCGLATYSEELVNNLKGEVAFSIVTQPFDWSICERISDADIVHVNHVNALFGALTYKDILKFKLMGKKTVCTFQESNTENRSGFTLAFDRVVVHQRGTVDGFTHIPHGIPDIDVSGVTTFRAFENFIGTAGFPIGFKNYEMLANVVHDVGAKLYAFIPESAHADALKAAKTIQDFCPGSIVRTDFASHEKIAKALATCVATVQPHNHAGGGVSGSVRMCLAAKRPTIISAASRFSDLLTDYRDEVYVMENAYPTVNDLREALLQVFKDIEAGCEKRPNRVITETNWRVCAQKYLQVYKEVMQ